MDETTKRKRENGFDSEGESEMNNHKPKKSALHVLSTEHEELLAAKDEMIKELKVKIYDLKEELNEVEKPNRKCKNSLLEADNLRRLEENATKLAAALRKEQKRRKAAEERVAELEAAVPVPLVATVAEAENKRLRDALVATTHDKDTLCASLTGAHANLEIARATISSLETQQKDWHTAQTRLEAALFVDNTTITTLTTAATTHAAKLQSLEDRIAHSVSCAATSHLQAVQLVAQVRDAQKIATDLTIENEKLQAKVKELQKLCQEQEAQLVAAAEEEEEEMETSEENMSVGSCNYECDNYDESSFDHRHSEERSYNSECSVAPSPHPVASATFTLLNLPPHATAKSITASLSDYWYDQIDRFLFTSSTSCAIYLHDENYMSALIERLTHEKAGLGPVDTDVPPETLTALRKDRVLFVRYAPLSKLRSVEDDVYEELYKRNRIRFSWTDSLQSKTAGSIEYLFDSIYEREDACNILDRRDRIEYYVSYTQLEEAFVRMARPTGGRRGCLHCQAEGRDSIAHTHSSEACGYMRRRTAHPSSNESAKKPRSRPRKIKTEPCAH